MLKRATLLFLAATALYACSVGQGAIPQPQPSRIDGVEARISEAVKSADRANAEALAVWEPVVPTLPEGVALLSEALVPIAVNWNGPIDGLLEAIADLTGYEFAVVGRTPAGQGTVAITDRNEPPFGVAVRAGHLVPGRAGVTLELHWASRTMRGVAKFLAACLVAECLLSKCAQDQAGQSLPAPDGAGGIPGWRGEAKPAAPPGEAMESTEVVAPIPDRDDIPDFRLRAALKSAGEGS